MKFLSDKAVDRLRQNANVPDLSGTRYQLLERVARGGMGVVYAALEGMVDRRVALKVLDTQVADSDLARRLNREARVLARLEHPGIVPVHDVGTLADGRVFYTMKFVEGQRLDRHIEAVTSLPDRLLLFLRICDVAHVDEGSDIFSLGAVLRFLCAPPAAEAHQNHAWRRDKALEAMCAKATENDPAKRYARVPDLSADVSRYLDGLPVSARKETIFDKALRFYRRHTVPILLIAAYLIVRTLILLFFHR